MNARPEQDFSEDLADLPVAASWATSVTEDLELYRVRDTRLEQNLWERMFGLGEIVLFTSDASTPEIHLHYIRDAGRVRELIRKLAEARRDAKRVRTFESGGGGHADLGGHDALD